MIRQSVEVLRILSVPLVLLLISIGIANNPPLPLASLMQVVGQVSLSDKPGVEGKEAKVGDKLLAGGLIKTGPESRAELETPELRLIRVGANTLFQMDPDGKKMQLNSGGILLQVLKPEGGAEIKTSTVSASVLGTTVYIDVGPEKNSLQNIYVFESSTDLGVEIFDQEGKSRGYIAAGQMLEVNPAEPELPAPRPFDPPSFWNSIEIGQPMGSIKNGVEKEFTTVQQGGKGNEVPDWAKNVKFYIKRISPSSKEDLTSLSMTRAVRVTLGYDLGDKTLMMEAMWRGMVDERPYMARMNEALQRLSGKGEITVEMAPYRNFTMPMMMGDGPDGSSGNDKGRGGQGGQKGPKGPKGPAPRPPDKKMQRADCHEIAVMVGKQRTGPAPKPDDENNEPPFEVAKIRVKAIWTRGGADES